MPLRGHRSSNGHAIISIVDLVYSEGHLDTGALEWAIQVAGTLQLSSTWQLVLGVVGKGKPSSLGGTKTMYNIVQFNEERFT